MPDPHPIEPDTPGGHPCASQAHPKTSSVADRRPKHVHANGDSDPTSRGTIALSAASLGCMLPNWRLKIRGSILDKRTSCGG